MKDKILTMFFDIDRWTKAIEKGVLKDIRKSELIKLTEESTRIRMAEAMLSGKYQITPPHTAQIPKDNGEFRTVYVNEPIDRIILSIANDLLFDLMPEMIHPACKSYQTGIGCGKVVLEVSHTIVGMKSNSHVGWKSDLSKYFDSVPIQFIDAAFDKVEAKHGHSSLIDVLRKYYHCGLYFDENNELHEKYQSLKQGCAVASWLANVLLYDLDNELSQMDGFYVRYSDDMLFVGPDYEKAMIVLQKRLAEMSMKLNPKKVEYLTVDRWFKFLGFSIKGSMISLSPTRLKTFQKEIESRTIKKRGITLTDAVRHVNQFLYKGNGEYSWATQILPVCNVRTDINELNKFVMDCLRAVETGKHKVGGLGYVRDKPNGCIVRGIGRNVKANRNKSKTKNIEGYFTIGCMQNAILIRRAVYNTLVATL
ncbi:reverse transcriptase domain-containing protein [Bacteroides sp. 2201st1_D9_2201SCRN_220225]|uniref:reverse transcriptase domain-containing protein n=1 Tax=Bacteroides sp. 2201st1_D9_2201SCRN_220225 TaxID=3143218 RepID=UPI0034A363A5